jgi:branched-chain amino acid transport system substrate-binding protein
MKKFGLCLIILCFIFLLTGQNLDAARRAYDAAFDPDKLGDMSDFDPDDPAMVPTGDTIKIAVVASFSGPAALVGEIYWISVLWAAHDINKRGGLYVDGKKKLIQVIRADTRSQPAQTKKVCERMVLEEKVDVMWGTDGSHIMKVINQVAAKYKKIAQCTAALSDELYDATNFTPYSFMSSFSCDQIGRGIAYFYGKVRKKETKFYILCQDYLFGHSMANGFKSGIKQYFPNAKIVGEDYHALFLKDFAPFLEKIKASGAEVVYTGDWIPDAANLLKQARAMGIKLPFAHIFLDEPNFLHEVGVEGSRGNIQLSQYGATPYAFRNKGDIKYYKAWNDLWQTKWKGMWKTMLFKHGTGNIGSYRMQTYWYLSVIERAKSTKPERVIRKWENDRYLMGNGVVIKMRACDHKAIQDLHVWEYVPWQEQKASFNIEPYYWYKDACSAGKNYKIPAKYVIPLMDRKLKRCSRASGF